MSLNLEFAFLVLVMAGIGAAVTAVGMLLVPEES